LDFLAPWRLGGSIPVLTLLGVLGGSVPSPAHAGVPIGFDDEGHLMNRTSLAAGLGAMRSRSRLSRKAWLR
jgi:hypothetical protein